MSFTDKYLSVWIMLAIILGFSLGIVFPDIDKLWQRFEHNGVNTLLAVCLVAMMYPPLAKVEYAKLGKIFRSFRVMILSTTLNWLIAPFIMFVLAFIFLRHAPEYMQGVIIIGLARCVAMVVVWSDLAHADRECTSALVAINSVFQILCFGFLAFVYLFFLPQMLGVELEGFQPLSMQAIVSNVLFYLGVPFVLGILSRLLITRLKGKVFYENAFLPFISPLTLIMLLFSIVVMCSYRADKIFTLPLDTLQIALPLIMYFIVVFFLSWFLCRKSRLSYASTCSVSLTASGNNFELAIALCIASFGVYSNQAFVAIIGPLVEVPVLLLLVQWALRQKGKF